MPEFFTYHQQFVDGTIEPPAEILIIEAPGEEVANVIAKRHGADPGSPVGGPTRWPFKWREQPGDPEPTVSGHPASEYANRARQNPDVPVVMIVRQDGVEFLG